MYKVRKSFEISAAHKLTLDYDSKCENLHGHNWHVTVWCQSEELDNNSMVIDFCRIKDAARELDHANLNELLPGNPTAENIARFLAEKIGDKCYRVEVQESDGNSACWEAE